MRRYSRDKSRQDELFRTSELELDARVFEYPVEVGLAEALPHEHLERRVVHVSQAAGVVLDGRGDAAALGLEALVEDRFHVLGVEDGRERRAVRRVDVPRRRVRELGDGGRELVGRERIRYP